MKMRYLLIPAFSFLFAGNVWAQSFTCTNCQVGTNAAVTGTATQTISTTPATPITDNIVLSVTVPSVFTITGAGDYTLSGVISGGNPDATAVSLEIQAGGGSSIILDGTLPNTYTGSTKISSGQLVLNKSTAADPATGVTAIPGNLIMTGSTENTVWCMADNQFNPGTPGTAEYKIDFHGAATNQRFNLFGTKQTIGGIECDNFLAILQHAESSVAGATAGPISPQIIQNAWTSRTTMPSFLTLNGNANYSYLGPSIIRAANSAQDITINKIGTGTQLLDNIRKTYNSPIGRVIFNVSSGTLVCQNPNPTATDSNVTNLTFNSMLGGTIELRGSATTPTNYSFGAGCIFTGPGAFKVTGASNTILLQSGVNNPGNTLSITGSITIESCAFRNNFDNVNWANSEADLTISLGGTFDLWGNELPTIFNKLSGAGILCNNVGTGQSPYGRELRIGVKDGTSTFDGTIVNNTLNNVPGGAGLGGSINLTKVGTGTQILTGANTYTGTTTISGGLLGGTGSIAGSEVTVGPGGGIFGGAGTGTNGVFTTGNLIFSGTAATPSHVVVYANNSATPAANALSLIQVGGTLASRTGTGTLTAPAGAIVSIDFMDPVTVADGDYTVISSADATALAGTFQVGIDNSGCCLAIVKNSSGIQVVVKKMTLTPPTLSICPSVEGIPKPGSMSVTCSAINTNMRGNWTITNNAKNAAGAATTGTGILSGSTVLNGDHNIATSLTGREPGSVEVVYTIPASAGCTGTVTCKVDIATKPTVTGAATTCSGTPVTLTGTISSGASAPDWNLYADNAAATGAKSIAGATISNGSPATTGIVTPGPTGGPLVIRVSDSNQCVSEPFTLTVTTGPALELLSGGIPGATNTTCPTGTTAGNTQPAILARYTGTKPASNTGITWTFASTATGWQAPSPVTTDVTTNANGVTGTYAIQYNVATTTGAAYTVSYNDGSGCSTSTLNLTVTRQPNLVNSANTTAATTLCVNATAVFSQSNADGDWKWQSGDPTIAAGGQEGIASGTTLTSTVTGKKDGSTTIFVTDVHGCNSEKLAITVNPSPAITTPSPSPSLCAAANGNAGAMSLSSQDAPGTADNPWAINPANAAATLTGLAADKKSIQFNVANSALTAAATVTVQYTGANGCAGKKDITINPGPVIDTGTPFTVCATVNGNAGTLHIGSSSAPGTADNPWSFNPAGTDADLSSLSPDKKSITFTVHDPNQATVKTATVQYVDVNGCFGTKVITINPSPKLAAATGTTLSALCSGSSNPAAITVSGAGGTGTTAWAITENTINTQVTGNDPLTTASVTAGITQAAVTHSITYTSGYGCVSNALSATISPGVTITLPANATNKICQTEKTLQLTAAGGTYTWSSGNEAVAIVNAQSGLVTSKGVGTAIISAAAATGCAGRQEVVVDNPQVGTAGTFNAAKLCGNNDYPDVLTLTNGSDQGAWRVYDAMDATAITNSTTAVIWGTDRSSTVKKGSIHTDGVSTTVTQYVAFIQNSCESTRLAITMTAPPVMDAVNEVKLCKGALSGNIVLTSTATGDQAANLFKWSGGADVGLVDKTDWTASPIPPFTAVNATTVITKLVTVTPSNSNSTCVGATKTFNITVNPDPVVTATPITPMCSGAETDFGLHSNVPDLLYTWTVTPNNGVGASDETTNKSNVKQTLTNRGTAEVTVTYTITPHTGGGCAGAPVTANMVVKNTAAVSAAGTMSGVTACLTPIANGTNGTPRSKAGGTYTTDITPRISPEDPNVKWKYKVTCSDNISGESNGDTPQTLTSIKDNLTSKSSTSETVTYTLTPYSGDCAGTATDVVIVLNPTPEFTGDANSVPDIALCGGVAHEDIEVLQVDPSGPARPTGFTWAVAGSGDDTGLADFTDNAHPRAKIGPFTATTVTAGKERTITLIPRNTTTGCAGLGQEVKIALRASPSITNTDPEICSTNPNPLVLTTANPGGAANDPTNPWKVLGGNSFASVGAHTGDGTKGDFTPANNAQTDTKTVDVQYTDANGCSAVAHVSVSYPSEITSFSPATHPVLCAGDTDDTAATTHIGISATKIGTKYTWSAARGTAKTEGNVSVDGGALPTAVSTVPKEEPLLEKIKAPAGTEEDIIFSVTPCSGSCKGAVKTITVKILGKGFPTNVTPATSNVVCSGLAPSITVGAANDGYTYSWTVDDHGGSVTGAEAKPSPGVSGGSLINSALSIPAGRTVKKAEQVTYNVVAIRDGCQGSPVAVNVEVDPKPAIAGVTSGSICSKSPTGIVLNSDIDASEAAKVKYTWTVDENKVGATADATAQSTFTEQTLTNSNTDGTDASATYTFTAAYGTCAGQPTAIVRTVTPPIATNTMSGGGKACLGDNVTLTSNAKGGTLTYKWWKKNGTIPLDGATGQSYTIPSNEESNDSYKVTVSNACQNEAALTQPQPVAVQVSKDSYFEGATATATYPDGGAMLGKDLVQFNYTPVKAEEAANTTYTWDFGDGGVVSTGQNPTHLYTASATSVTPTLIVKKAGQDACTKTWTLSAVVLKPDPAAGDPVNYGGFRVFPIPANDRITIIGESEISRIKVSDLNGKQLLSMAATGRQVVVPVSGLSSGLYILTAETAGGEKYMKIVKE